MVPGGVTALMARIIMGNVGGYGWGRRRHGSRNPSHADPGETAGGSGVRDVVAMAISATMVAASAGMGILLLSRRSVIDIFGIEGEVGGIGQETFLFAFACVRSRGNDQNNQNGESSHPKN